MERKNNITQYVQLHATTHTVADAIEALPLRRRAVHDDIDPEDLHRIERVRQSEESRQGNESEGGDTPER